MFTGDERSKGVSYMPSSEYKGRGGVWEGVG